MVSITKTLDSATQVMTQVCVAILIVFHVATLFQSKDIKPGRFWIRPLVAIICGLVLLFKEFLLRRECVESQDKSSFDRAFNCLLIAKSIYMGLSGPITLR